MNNDDKQRLLAYLEWRANLYNDPRLNADFGKCTDNENNMRHSFLRRLWAYLKER
jgi:hypothetical protein